MANEPALQELTAHSASIGRWLLTICGDLREVEYVYTWRGETKTGKKVVATLVSADSDQYCLGMIKKKGKDPKASQDLTRMMEKFATGTIWHMTKISLVPEKTLYISTPVKIVIDLAATVCTPVLQGTRVMPKCPTPAEDLETILKCPQNQRVDVTAFVVALENERGATT